MGWDREDFTFIFFVRFEVLTTVTTNLCLLMASGLRRLKHGHLNYRFICFGGAYRIHLEEKGNVGWELLLHLQ